MEKMVYKAIIRYLKKHYPGELDKIVKRAKESLPELKAKAPDLGGRKNTLANNMDMFLLFLSFYEASDHRMAGEAIDEIIADLYARLKFLNGIMNINHPRFLKILRKYMYKSYQAYADKVKQKKSGGEWLETWDMIVDPENTEEGFAFTLVGCPIADYAKKYGYEELMPHMCALDTIIRISVHMNLTKNAHYPCLCA